jgi:hypothetical protein
MRCARFRIILVSMENAQLDSAHFGRKAEEYRDKARATVDPRLKAALEAVAREYIRKARDFDGAAAPPVGIH